MKYYQGINLRGKYINADLIQTAYKYLFFDLNGNLLYQRFITMRHDYCYRIRRNDLHDNFYSLIYLCIKSNIDDKLIYYIQVDDSLRFVHICEYYRSKYREYILFTPLVIAMHSKNVNFTYIQQFCNVNELLQANELMLKIASAQKLLQRCL